MSDGKTWTLSQKAALYEAVALLGLHCLDCKIKLARDERRQGRRYCPYCWPEELDYEEEEDADV